MPWVSTRCRALALALALPSLLTIPGAAQGPGDKDLKVISAYSFTMPKYRQLMNAMINLGKAAERDPKLAAALESSGNQSLDQMAASYERVAPARKAIADAGLTTREYAVALSAMLQVGMSYGLMKEYELTADSVSRATGVSKANLEFYRTHETELTRMSQEMEAMMPKDRQVEAAGAAEEAPDSSE